MFWSNSSTRPEVDIGVLEEAALASAQAAICKVMKDSGLSQSEVARKMGRDRSYISRILSGSHNLTVKTMARTMAVCGYEVDFQPRQIEWNWVALPATRESEVPANAGTTMLLCSMAA